MARAKAMDVAIEAKDLPHVHLEMAELNVASQLILIDVSSEFCNLLDFGGGTGQGGRPPPPQAPSGPGPMPGLCGGLAVPGGEYGESIDRLSRRFSVQFGPRVSFPEGLKPDELLRGLTYVQPAIVDLFERTLAELDAIGPPAEYEVGHQVLHDYFDELRSNRNRHRPRRRQERSRPGYSRVRALRRGLTVGYRPTSRKLPPAREGHLSPITRSITRLQCGSWVRCGPPILMRVYDRALLGSCVIHSPRQSLP